MIAYKINTETDEKGNLFLFDLPFDNKQQVEVIILIKGTQQEKIVSQKRLELLKASFGTIDSTANIADGSLSRVNLYENDGR